jgi:hypothetical protein
MSRVTTLESRTPHQSAKLLEAAKERLCFYSFYFYSQQKLRPRKPPIFSRVQAIHSPMPEIGATQFLIRAKKSGATRN